MWTEKSDDSDVNSYLEYRMNRLIISFISAIQISCSGGLSVSTSDREAECIAAECEQVVDEPTEAVEANTGSSAGVGCKEPPLDKIPSDVKVRMCSGVMAAGKLPVCSGAMRQGCLTTPDYPAVRIAPETYGRMLKAMSINGQTGQLSECNSDMNNGCITTNRFRSVNAQAIDQNLVKSGSLLGGLSGALDAPCTSAGAVGCVTTALFPAVKGTDLTSANIAADAAIGSVNGSLKVTRRCKNAARLARYDAFGPSNLVFTLPRSAVDTVTDTFTFSANHGMKTGFPFRMSGAPLPAPLVADTAYYAIVDPANPTKAKVALSEADAFNSISVDITDQGSDTQTVRPFGDASVGFWDLIDDFANGAATPPTDLFFSAGETCGPETFQRIDGTAGRVPSGVIPASGNVAWTEIWQDTTTGLMFTNILYTGGGSTMHADALKLCASLNSGDGPGKWYLPTQKELIGLYINGASHVPMSGRGFYGLWTSTQVRSTSGNAWHVYITDGATPHGLRINVNYGVLCVRFE